MTQPKMMKILKTGFINEAGQPIGYEFDGQPRLRMKGDGTFGLYAGYTREQLEIASSEFEGTGAIPDALTIAGIQDSRKQAGGNEVADAVKAVSENVDSPFSAEERASAQESTASSNREQTALASGAWTDVVFSFIADLVNVSTKGGGEDKARATEIKLSTTEVKKLLELAADVGNRVDVEIKISRYVSSPIVQGELPLAIAEPEMVGEESAPEPTAREEDMPPEPITETVLPIKTDAPELFDTTEEKKEDF